MTLALGDQMKTWVDEVVGKNRDLEEEVKTLTLKLENCKGQVDNLQAKIRDLEEEVKILKSVMSGGEKEVSDFSKSRVLLEEENKSLRLEQLELTVKYQMRKMWEMINLELKDNPYLSKQQKQIQFETDSDLRGQQLISSGILQQEVTTETNPLKVEKILDTIFDSLPRSCLFKFRRVCKLWNNTLVPKINQHGRNTRLLKIVDPLGGKGTYPGDDEGRSVKVIDIKEILYTMEAGRLEYSTCTNIYFDASMDSNPNVFETFLVLHGKNIKVLHYDGDKISELKKVLKMCAHELERLSLWKLSGSRSSWKGLYENDGEPKLIFPKLENIIFVSGEDGNLLMMAGVKMKNQSYYPYSGLSSPSEDFLIDIFEASPKLHSLSCRLYGSRFLEALTQTNSYSKLTSLCLKSRVGIPQLRSLISANMRLRILQLEGFCVSIHTTYNTDWFDDKTGQWIDRDPNDDPELMEFAPLLLKFLKSQARTLEYLKLDLFTERGHPHPDIPIDVLLNQFPCLPNLITFLVGTIGTVDGNRIDFPFQISTFPQLFPKLMNLENIPFDYHYYGGDDYPDIDDPAAAVEGDVDFPIIYPVSPNASFSLKNIRGVEISPDLAQFFPCITELHLGGNIGSLHKIPSCLPRLKHFYYEVDIEKYEEAIVHKLIRILNGFFTGISPEECQRTEDERRGGHHAFVDLHQVQFARSRPSIFNLNDLETLGFTFSCHEFSSMFQRGRGILTAVEVLISYGLSRLTHLKKLRIEYDPKVNSGNGLPESLGALNKAFRNRNNLKIHTQGYTEYGWAEDIRGEKNWNFELNLNHHTSEWNQFALFTDDPDIWCLGLRC